MDAPQRKLCKRYNIPRHAHYLTFSCFQRRPLLTKDRSRQWLLRAIRRARLIHEFHIWAWVIMPEHVHLILWPQRESYSISEILYSIKKPVTNAALRYVRRHAPAFLASMQDVRPDGRIVYRFWQRGGGYDRNLVTAGEIWEKIGYVNRNPVRRGLVARPEEWTWSSAADYLGVRAVPLLPLNRESIPSKW
jgi:putative transposase